MLCVNFHSVTVYNSAVMEFWPLPLEQRIKLFLNFIFFVSALEEENRQDQERLLQMQRRRRAAAFIGKLKQSQPGTESPGKYVCFMILPLLLLLLNINMFFSVFWCFLCLTLTFIIQKTITQFHTK